MQIKNWPAMSAIVDNFGLKEFQKLKNLTLKKIKVPLEPTDVDLF